ncbi:sarcosine oxidase subunit beta [Tistlia consotensis]|uniref:Sarcosine oxidase subunit beta n=1 Tax=Tistlia consotensis USBA 355 TaxID=560819 RepID=A0A1Y6CTL0_9PROT|nr:FAD-binding oxidoreductase [Tistlia consotensis]SMF77097.1 sarcosine oxidase subunit beta [Tistlia consotensis USBA 355]SNS14136.1 sarcosine oxidase subunit beta [Tistlia consotensis]
MALLARADVVVVGGGLHGCSAALHCALRGLSVVVVEKNTVARHASGVNAGGVRRLGRHPAEIPISVFSMKLWHRIAELVDDDCGFQPAPQIKVAETEAELAALSERAALVRGLGYEHEELLDQARLRELLPAVAEHCVGGLASMGDGYAVPYLTTFAFQRKARALGVRFFEETRAQELTRDGTVWRLSTDRGTVEAETLVNCGGAWANLVAARLGEPAPVEAIAPMMLVTARLPHFCDAVVGATGRPLSFKQMPNGTVVIGGGRRGVADPETDRTDLRFAELRLTARTAAEVFPVMAGATIVRGWAGIEGRMPDDIPVIGPSTTEERVFHAFGFSAHGFQLGPGVGSIMAELVATGATQAPIAPFSIGRFQGGGSLAAATAPVH